MASNLLLDINKFEKKNKIGGGSFAKAFTVIDKNTKEICLFFLINCIRNCDE